MKAKAPFVPILAALFFAGFCPAQEPVGGIGVAVTMVEDRLTVMKVLPKTPASEAGLTAGLVIVMIDGVLTPGKTLQECIERIRGRPGTKLRLELIDPESGKGMAKELTRRLIR